MELTLSDPGLYDKTIEVENLEEAKAVADAHNTTYTKATLRGEFVTWATAFREVGDRTWHWTETRFQGKPLDWKPEIVPYERGEDGQLRRVPPQR